MAETEIPILNTYIKLIALFLVTYCLLIMTVYATFWYTAANGISENFASQTVFLIWGIVIATAIDIFILIAKKFIDTSIGKKSLDERLDKIENTLSKIEKNTKKKRRKKK